MDPAKRLDPQPERNNPDLQSGNTESPDMSSIPATPAENKPAFPGFSRPHGNFTPVPDEFFDHLAPKLSEAELKVTLYIIRRTLGFKRPSDSISLSQLQNGILRANGERLDNGCGIVHRTNLLRAIRSLEDKRVIQADRSATGKVHNTTAYRLVFRDSDSVENTPGGGADTAPRGSAGKALPGSALKAPGVVPEKHPQYTEEKYREKQNGQTGVPPNEAEKQTDSGAVDNRASSGNLTLLKEHIEAFGQYADGSPVVADEDMLKGIVTKAKFFKLTQRQIAAGLYRKLTGVQLRPSTRPQSRGYFIHAIEEMGRPGYYEQKPKPKNQDHEALEREWKQREIGPEKRTNRRPEHIGKLVGSIARDIAGEPSR